jgi:hypothetical protein
MKLIFVILFILAVLLVLAIKFLPWWASVLLLVAGVLGVRWGAKYLLRKVFILPFKMKGQALAGAALQVHSIESAPMPEISTDFAEEEATEYENLRWYWLDVTIVPAPASTTSAAGFVAWSPGDLLLVPPDLEEEDLLGGYCIIHDCKVFADNHFQEDTQGKYDGSQRLQLYIGVQSGIKELSFRYYFELFGLISIPPHRLKSLQESLV